MRIGRALTLGLHTPDLLAFGGGFVLLVGVTAALSFLANRHYVEAAARQPVEFNHRLHVEDEGLECDTCHLHYERQTFSGFPSAAVCALCHLEPQGESRAEEKLVRLLEEGAPLEWDSVFRQPPHVFFSHRRHVSVAGLECATCHGEVASSEEALHERQPLSMDTCVECHEREETSNACTRCHR